MLMLVYHFHADLYAFGMLSADLMFHPLVSFLQVFFASIFIVISGISSRFSKHNLRRGLLLLLAAFGITAVTFFFDKNSIVRFGILHFLGTAIVIYALVGKYLRELLPRFLPGIIYPLLAALTWPILSKRYDVKWLWILGFRGQGFQSADYFPLFPYIFVFLFGTWLGGYIMKNKFPAWFYKFKCRPLAFIGRNTIWIYLLHQPIFYSVFLILGKTTVY